MSRNVVRLLLALALALAVPFQGYAVASAGLCMALGQHDAGATHSHDTDSPGGHHDNDSSHCAPCVACCASAAIAACEPPIVADANRALPGAAAPPLFDGIRRSPLDRPPLAL